MRAGGRSDAPGNKDQPILVTDQCPGKVGNVRAFGLPASIWHCMLGRLSQSWQPGDLLVFRNTVRAGLSHVGIYVGNGTVVHSEWYGYGVTVTSLSNDPRDGWYWTDHFLAANRITTTGE